MFDLASDRLVSVSQILTEKRYISFNRFNFTTGYLATFPRGEQNNFTCNPR